MAWDQERCDKLTTLWNAGHSASVIAGMLGGVTRNAVIGRVHRMKLARRAESPSTKAAYGRVGAKASKAARRVREGKPPTAIRKGLSQWPSDNAHLKTREPLPSARLLAIVDLEANHCSWVHDTEHGHRYCGCDAVVGTAWCAEHLSTVYRPIVPRRDLEQRDFIRHYTKNGAMA